MRIKLDDSYRSLIEGFLIGIDAAFLKRDKLDQVWEIILHSRNGEYFSLKNSMIDLEERKEEGQIAVSQLSSINSSDYMEVCFPRVLRKNGLFFLLSQDSRNAVPSGIRLVEEGGTQHDIVVGAAPESLVFLSPFYGEKKLPEYPIDCYSAVSYKDLN